MDKVYCYPDTSVLINKLDIHDKDQLITAETSLVAVRLYQLQKNPIRGSFDYKHLCRIHHYIFQDLYSWAGKTRTVDIAKTSLFCLVQFIPGYANSIFPNILTTVCGQKTILKNLFMSSQSIMQI